jgi:hypothetical protein
MLLLVMRVGGQYRRAFEWRLVAPGNVPLAASSFAFERLALPDQLEWLEDLLSISRNRRKNGLVLRKVQLAWTIHDFAGEKRKGALKD